MVLCIHFVFSYLKEMTQIMKFGFYSVACENLQVLNEWLDIKGFHESFDMKVCLFKDIMSQIFKMSSKRFTFLAAIAAL